MLLIKTRELKYIRTLMKPIQFSFLYLSRRTKSFAIWKEDWTCFEEGFTPGLYCN